jgi:uncharacterized protein DUF3365
MTRKILVRGTVLTTMIVLACWNFPAGGKPPTAPSGIPPETVADYVHAVIEADRTFYTVHVVERLQKKGKMVASENWRTKDTLPLPAQFLMESSDLAMKTGTKVQYRLIGAWPINPQNGPATDFEKKGIENVQTHPEHPYTETTMRGEDQVFQAIYADRAVAQACIGCHNAHSRSPKRDFKLDDVMGGIVITIPLGKPAG